MTPTLLPYLAGGCLKLLTPLTRRLTTAVVRQRPVVRTATALADLLIPLMATLPQEEVRLVLLDRQLRVLGLPLLYRGTADHLPAMRVSEVFRPAIQAGAVAVVLVHNHVTASATPSVADCAMTDEVIVAGHQFGVEVIDHLIIARGGWYSLRQHGDCEFIPIDHERRDPEAGPSTWDAPAC